MVADSEIVSQRAQARVGLVLRDKWRLDRVLGVGGMAAVYEATHRNGKRVAVKMLHANLAIGGDTMKRFLREGYVANKVNHPDAVSVLDDDTAEDGSAFVVMELLEGETLDQRCERLGGTMSVPDVLAVTDQILDILAAAHKADIVHRDVKPDNIFLTAQGTTKLLDFGIARLREGGGPQGTSEGMFMGTPAFTPPEQARGEWQRVDPRTDLWAVGAVMFRLLSGRSVHDADTASMQLIAVATQPAPPLCSIAPHVPPAVAAVVDRALAFDIDGRWPDARAMQTAVREAYRSATGTALQTLSRVSARSSFADLGRASAVPGGGTWKGALAMRPTEQLTGAPVTEGSRKPPTRPSLLRWAIPVGGVALAAAGALIVLGSRPSASPALAPIAAAPPASAPPRTPDPEPTSGVDAAGAVAPVSASASASAPTASARAMLPSRPPTGGRSTGPTTQPHRPPSTSGSRSTPPAASSPSVDLLDKRQ